MKIQKVLAVNIVNGSGDAQSDLNEVNTHLEQGWRVKDVSSIALPAGEGYRSRALSYFILEKSSSNEK